MKNLELTQKMAVAHCAFQLIASAEGNIDEERDYCSIKLVTDTLQISIYIWDSALKQNPHDCFFHISELNELHKGEFKNLMYQLAELEGNHSLRKICAESLYNLCNL